MKPEYDIVPFVDAAAWRQWLSKHNAKIDGIWIQMYKKASGVESITYAQALDEALCYGWIDGQKKSYDELSFLQKFTPRRKASMWSKRNIEHIARLTDTGLMTPAGVTEVDRAKADGRWDAAYDMPSRMVVPDYFIAEVDKNPKVKEFYTTLNKTKLYSIAWRLQTAKTDETRKRRMDKMIAMLETGIFI